MSHWTAEMTEAYMQETARRFHERSPAQCIDDIDWRSRVGRGEMRTWAKSQRLMDAIVDIFLN